MSGPLLLGVDAGLTNLAVAAFDDRGTPVASASGPTPDPEAGPGRDEQDHDALWAATADLIRTVVDDDAVDLDRIAGVGLAGHGHGLYALDADGDPVVGVKSTDDRGTALVAEWAASGLLDAVTDRLGWRPFGADPYSLLGWFDRERPAVADRIDAVLACKDVLRYRLTGAVATDPMDGSALVPPDGDVEAALGVLGLERFAAAAPEVVPSTAVSGRVTDAAAERTGLPAGVPVAGGLHDVGACTLGAGVTDPGEATTILGTWGQSVVVVDGPDHGEGGLPRRYLGGWLRYRGTRAGAACLDWFVEEFGAGWRETARERGVDPYDVYERRAEAVGPGAGGVVFLPYLDGSTDDPEARGSFTGLALDHGRDEMLRAVYEGVATALAGGVDDFGVELAELRVSGGGARSELWPRTFADLLDRPVRVPAVAETGALGAALCAGVAAGAYDDVDAAVGSAVTVDRRHEPDPARVERYRTLWRAFRENRDALAGTWGTLMPPSDEQGSG